MLGALVEQTGVAIERIQLAATVDEARLKADTEQVRNAILTSVSHDLRTPLTTIIGAQSALRAFVGPDSADAWELLDRAQGEAERLNRLIGNLLDMTRLDSGKFPIRMEPIDIGEALESAIERAEGLIAGHSLDVALDPDMPMAEGDFLLLEQVFFNVIDNAVKFASPGSPIEIGAGCDDRFVWIDISDRGPGIPDEALETIFDKFARIQGGAGSRPGTGLGLTVCRGFLRAMGGAISAANRNDGCGAVFTIRLARFAG